MTQKTILHITVGTPDWEPIAEDLRNICEDFKGAVHFYLPVNEDAKPYRPSQPSI